MNIDDVGSALFAGSVDEKLKILKSFKSSPIPSSRSKDRREWVRPTYANFCKCVDPRDVKKRNKIYSDEGLAVFLHSIAHIEFFAIDLALDAVYRFVDMPEEYYGDWLEVAFEEELHFSGIRTILNDLGYEYGDFPVHYGLFNAVKKCDTLLERMALIPMGFEANGLDSNLALRKKIKNNNPGRKDVILENLDVILKDEISHVKKGNVWFEFARKNLNLPRSVFFETIAKHYPRLLHLNKELNVEARLEAGFSIEEIEILRAGR